MKKRLLNILNKIMKKTKVIHVLSHYLFDERMIKLGLNDDNVEDAAKNKNMKKNFSGSNRLNGKAFEKIINYNINRKIIKNLNLNNYKKYHDVNMALTETKKEVNSFFKTQKLKLNSNKNKYKLKINDNSIINLNSDSKINFGKAVSL